MMRSIVIGALTVPWMRLIGNWMTRETAPWRYAPNGQNGGDDYDVILWVAVFA
jgi:hypothetical protein